MTVCFFPFRLNNAYVSLEWQPANVNPFVYFLPPIENEFIKKIVVHAPDKSRGHRVQKKQIVFNFIGEFTPQKEFIPDKKEIPQDYF